jgi:hypothetical protein
MPDKPSSNEEEYFHKQEQEKLEKLKREGATRRAAEEKEARKALHQMKCPKCGGDLHEQAFHGVSVDRCGECGGVWFDAGEVESLVEKEAGGLQGFFGDLIKSLPHGKKKK